MICPDRCTMELWGTYQGIKINQVYKCKWCTVTSYRSVEMSEQKRIEQLEGQLSRQRVRNLGLVRELERIGSDLKSAWVHGYNTGHNAGISCGHPMAKVCRHDGAEEVGEYADELAALASPAGESESKDANRHGLDARYFREKLGQLVRDIDSYTPEEMHLALVRLAETAQPAPVEQSQEGEQ